MKISTRIPALILICSSTCAVSVVQQGYVLVPLSEVQGSEPRQGIIAGWIQGSQVFPIQNKIPEVISNVANGVQEFVAQGVINGVQNVGAVAQIYISALGQRFPIINRVPFIGSQNQRTPQKLFVLRPSEEGDKVESIPDPTEQLTYP